MFEVGNRICVEKYGYGYVEMVSDDTLGIRLDNFTVHDGIDGDWLTISSSQVVLIPKKLKIVLPKEEYFSRLTRLHQQVLHAMELFGVCSDEVDSKEMKINEFKKNFGY